MHDATKSGTGITGQYAKNVRCDIRPERQLPQCVFIGSWLSFVEKIKNHKYLNNILVNFLMNILKTMKAIKNWSSGLFAQLKQIKFLDGIFSTKYPLSILLVG